MQISGTFQLCIIFFYEIDPMTTRKLVKIFKARHFFMKCQSYLNWNMLKANSTTFFSKNIDSQQVCGELKQRLFRIKPNLTNELANDCNLHISCWFYFKYHVCYWPSCHEDSFSLQNCQKVTLFDWLQSWSNTNAFGAIYITHVSGI